LLILDLLLPLLMRLSSGFDLEGKIGPAAAAYTRSYVEDKWRKAVKRIVKRMETEGVGLDHVTEVRPNPPEAYVAFIVSRLWASVLKGGMIVDAFRDSQTPKIMAEVAPQLNDDHSHNVRAVITSCLRLTF
jgi:hypothetical protein